MKTNRHVPLIMGLAALGFAIWLIVEFSGWWKYIPGAFLLMFGWASLKTALLASDKEISELTGNEPMSEETKKKFEDNVATGHPHSSLQETNHQRNHPRSTESFRFCLSATD